MKSIRLVLPILLVAAASPAQTNTAEHFAGLGATFTNALTVMGSATISNTLAVAGASASGSGSLAHGFSIAAGEYAVALGFGASAPHDKAFVWSGGTTQGVQSSQAGQFVIYAPGGIHLLGGTIYGQGTGLTNISVNSLIDLGSAGRCSSNAFTAASTGQAAYNTASWASNVASTALQADGTVPWSQAQNAGGQVLTNVASVLSTRIVPGFIDVTGSVVTALYVEDTYGPLGDTCMGDMTNGFQGEKVAIVWDGGWKMTWSVMSDDDIGGQSFPSGMSFNYRDGYASYDLIYQESTPIGMVIYASPNSGGIDISGTYDGNESTGFSGPYTIWTDGNGGWWITLPECGMAQLTMDSSPYASEPPSGSIDTGGGHWVSISPCYGEQVWQEPAYFTNEVPFEVADGRHAWVGTHDAGGFGLTNLSQIVAGSVAGDGALLFNIGSAAILDGSIGAEDLDFGTIDSRYVVRVGDNTITGSLTVTGEITSDGRPFPDMSNVPMQGDISMGSYTNR